MNENKAFTPAELAQKTRDNITRRHQEETARMHKEEEILANLPPDFPLTSVFAYPLYGRVGTVKVTVHSREEVDAVWEALPGLPAARFRGSGSSVFTYAAYPNGSERFAKQFPDADPCSPFFWEHRAYRNIPGETFVEWFAELPNKDIVDVKVIIEADPAYVFSSPVRDYRGRPTGEWVHTLNNAPEGKRMRYSGAGNDDPGTFIMYYPHTGYPDYSIITRPADIFNPPAQTGEAQDE